MINCHEMSLFYSSPLLVNVSASVYFFQVQVHLTLQRVHRVCKCNVFRKIIPWSQASVFFVEKRVQKRANFLKKGTKKIKKGTKGQMCPLGYRGGDFVYFYVNLRKFTKIT